MTGSDRLEDKHARNRAQRREQIRAWAAYVRAHPDADWGEQVNRIVDSQLQSARHVEDERPDVESLGDSSLFDE